MRYGEFRDLVLQLINLYSVRGQVLGTDYNDLADYRLRIPALLNTALTEIAAETHMYADASGCHRQPELVDLTPGAAIEELALDGSEEVLQTAAFFAAAMLVLQDDAFAYQALRNEYDGRLSQMRRRLTAVQGTVEDAYGLAAAYRVQDG